MNEKPTINHHVTIIAAVAENGAIGYENKLLYWLPNDLKRFKNLTTGHTIIMGRHTYESLPNGALPNRRNIVLSRSGKKEDFTDCELYSDLIEALSSCSKDEDIFIIGGASVYAEAMPYASHLFLTIVHDTPLYADAYFPPYGEEWIETSCEDHKKDEKHAYNYSFVDYTRREK